MSGTPDRVAMWRSSRAVPHEEGQGTVEFALVTAGFLSIVIVLGLLWHALGDGLFVDHALSAASHHVHAAASGAISDVFLY